MGYVTGYLKKYGQACTIQRTPTVTSSVSKKRSSKSSDPTVRDSLYEGLILSDSALASGEVFVVGTDSFLVQSVVSDEVSGEVLWFALRCNATVTHQRYTETADGDGNLVQSWSSLATASGWMQVVTARMRQEDPGLVDGARYLLQVPSSLGVQVLDRFVYGSTNYQVEAVDDVAMAGVVRVQLGADLR